MKKLVLFLIISNSSFVVGQNQTNGTLKNNLEEFNQQLKRLEDFLVTFQKEHPKVEKPKIEEPEEPEEPKTEVKKINKQSYDVVMQTYNQLVSSLPMQNPLQIRDQIKKFKMSVQSSLQEKPLSEIIVHAGNQFFDLYESNYQEFKKELPNFFTLLVNIINDMNNWFVNANKPYFYKGKDVPNYKQEFTFEDYEIYKKSLNEYERLKTRALESPGQWSAFIEKNKKHLDGYKKWIELSPTITFDKKKFSPLEEQVKNNLIQKIQSYQNIKNPSKPQKENVKKLFDDLTVVLYRNDDKDALKSLAFIYRDILGLDLTWSQNFTEYKKQLDKNKKGAEFNYNQLRKKYENITIKDRTQEDYKEIKEAFEKLVKFKAPNESQLKFYENIGKEIEYVEPEKEQEQEEEEEDQEQEEKIKEELESIKDISDFSSYSRENIEHYIKLIQTYRKLSSNQRAYLRAFTFLQAELKKK